MTKKILKLIAPIAFLFAILIIPVFFINDNKLGVTTTVEEEVKFNDEKAKLTKDKQVKAENKSDVLFAKTAKSCLEENNDKICIKDEMKVSYAYKSNVKVPRQIRKNNSKAKDNDLLGADDGYIYEDISARTNNTMIFPGTPTSTLEVISGAAWYQDGEDWYEIEYDVIPIIEYNLQMETNFSTTTGTSTVKWYNPFIINTALADVFDEYSAAGDGCVSYYKHPYTKSDSDWATIRESANATDVYDSGYDYTYYSPRIYWSNNTNGGLNNRANFPFDTSSLPTGAEISSSTMYLYRQSGADSFSGQHYRPVITTMGDETALAVGDYNYTRYGDTSLTGTDYSYVDAANNNKIYPYHFDSYGNSQINNDDYTVVGLRDVEHDIADAKPTIEKQKYMLFKTVEYTGTDWDPRLVIEYTSGGAVSNPCAPTPGQPFFQSQDCFIKSDTFHNDKWITNGYKLVPDGGKLILE